jgi:hypothetical protein
MNFEELKSDWEKEPSGEVNVPATVKILKETNQPIEAIKKNMRKEAKTQIIAMISIGFYPQLFDILFGNALFSDKKPAVMFNPESYPVFYLLYFTAFVVLGFYGNKYYQLFKKLYDYSASTKDSFYELYYELKLNIETYKTLNVAVTPFVIILFIHIWVSLFTPQNMNVMTILNHNWLIFCIIIIGSSAYMYWATNWWINKFYGKPLIQLKGLLDELKEVV